MADRSESSVARVLSTDPHRALCDVVATRRQRRQRGFAALPGAPTTARVSPARTDGLISRARGGQPTPSRKDARWNSGINRALRRQRLSAVSQRRPAVDEFSTRTAPARACWAMVQHPARSHAGRANNVVKATKVPVMLPCRPSIRRAPDRHLTQRGQGLQRTEVCVELATRSWAAYRARGMPYPTVSRSSCPNALTIDDPVTAAVFLGTVGGCGQQPAAGSGRSGQSRVPTAPQAAPSSTDNQVMTATPSNSVSTCLSVGTSNSSICQLGHWWCGR